MKNLILILGCALLLLVGCTTEDYSDIPECHEINKTPFYCYAPEEMELASGWVDIWTGEEYQFLPDNISEAKCKRYSYRDGLYGKWEFCFDFVEDMNFTFDWNLCNITKEKENDSTFATNETNLAAVKKEHYFVAKGMYCYEDSSAGIECTCDTLTYPDGHNETRNCYCVNDLVMYMRCINLTEENITLTEGVRTP